MDAGDGSEVRVVLLDGDVELVVGRLDSTRPNLAMVDALAQLHLAARRLGWSVRLRDPGREFCALLDLVGLADVVTGCGASGLRLEALGKAEGCEQLGVQEVMEPGDPVA